MSESRIAIPGVALRPLIRIPYHLRRAPLYVGTMLASCALGVAIAGQDALSALQLVVGLPIMVALWRYRYALLLCWLLIGTLIPENVPLLSGHHFDTALTIPTLLLLPVIPIKDTFKRMPALALLMAYVLWQLLGINISPLDHVTFLQWFASRLCFVVLTMLTINELSTLQRLSRFIDIVLVTPLWVALYGIYGYLTHQNVISEATEARITSVFVVPPTLALFLSIAAPLALYRIFTAQKAGRLVASLVFCVLLLAIALTFTRGAMLAIALYPLIAIPLLPSRAMKMRAIGGTLGLVALISALAAVGGIPIFSRFFISSDLATLNGRTYLWKIVLEHFDPAQLLGNGQAAAESLLGHMPNNSGGPGTAASKMLEAHNIFVQDLYNYGIIGLTLLILMFVALAVGMIAAMRKATGDRRVLLAMSFLTLVTVVLQCFEGADLFSQTFGIYFFVIVALPFATGWSESGAPAKQVGVPSDRVLPKGAVAGFPAREGQWSR